LHAQYQALNASFIVKENKICQNSKISILNNSIGNITRWEWSFEGAVPSSSNDKTPENICYYSSGTYKVGLKVYDDNGDMSNYTTEIVVNPIIPALITAFPIHGFAPLKSQLSTTAAAYSCKWDVDGISYSGISSIDYIFKNEGNHDVCLVTENHLGCKDSSCVTVNVLNSSANDPSFIIIPNVFTPNNDLLNDIFRSTSLNIAEWDSRIYNRWGHLVYHSVEPDIMWDGKWNGKPCEDGVYVYVIKAVGGDGKIFDLSGTLTLFR
jgi:gliding motility-associated-like protein